MNIYFRLIFEINSYGLSVSFIFFNHQIWNDVDYYLIHFIMLFYLIANKSTT